MIVLLIGLIAVICFIFLCSFLGYVVAVNAINEVVDEAKNTFKKENT